MQLIDTHSHIYLKDFDGDRAEVVSRAISRGVVKTILPAIDSTLHSALLQTANQFPQFCVPLMGLHPTSVKENYKEELALVEELLAKHTFFGIGEIGIDLYWDKTFIEEQKIAFTHQVRLAKKLRLPIVIHTREAFPEVLSIIDNENSPELTGVFHSFSGGIDEYNRIASYGGFKVGIGGVVTYKNSGLDRVVSQMDINHIVLETDSPYLSPVPHRGQRNECANISYVSMKIADILGLSVSKVADVTTENASSLFNIKL